jgi:serine phosphatase RsbU (regulator of sigma subunit)
MFKFCLKFKYSVSFKILATLGLIFLCLILCCVVFHCLNIFFIFIFFLLLVAVYFFCRKFIISPLKIIEESLNSESEYPLNKLLVKGDELGKIARLIANFFNQGDLLKANNAELFYTKEELKRLNAELNNQKTSVGEQNEQLQSLYEELIAQQEEMTVVVETLKEANEKILIQNENIEEKNKENIDGMRYAGIIQRAVFSTSFDLNKVFSEHFIYYRPQNIVSGDFYWFSEFHGKHIIVAADCTGHGLSGSLMSMLGFSFLKEVVSRIGNQDRSAAEILNIFRNFIVDSLHQTDDVSEIHDGIDLVFCIIDKINMKLEYAAAFNPFYIVRFNEKTLENELLEFKGDRMPVGIYQIENSFTNYIIDIQNNDKIYLFSDGYLDQFGGSKGKKFLSANFKNLILEVSPFPFQEQKILLNRTLEDWKGSEVQTDDVMVIGIKI